MAAAAGAVGIGALACAILVANNLRDLETDALTGKRTLAVRLGERATRALYTLLVVVAFAMVPVAATVTVWALIAGFAAVLAIAPVRRVRGGSTGRDLIAVLGATGRLELGYAVLLGLGLALGQS